MAKYTNEGVQFTGIRTPAIITGGKLGAREYETDENGNIIGKSFVINAIDIDWNKATAEGIGPISTTEDLINTLKEIKLSIGNQGGGGGGIGPQGPQGIIGPQGIMGPQGTAGKSAYELAKEIYEELHQSAFPYENINAWIESLQGAIGPQGSQGVIGPQGEAGQQGIAGPQGTAGKSAYELAQEYYDNIGEEFPYNSEDEWIQQFILLNGAQANVIESITSKYQIFNGIQGIQGKFITISQPQDSKNVELSINMDLLDDLTNDIINKSYNQSKEYTDDRLNWNVI